MANLGSVSPFSPRVLRHNAACVSGVVKEVGALAPRRCVRLYLRSTGGMLTQTYTLPNGSFVLPTQRTLEGQATFAIAFDDESGEPFNTLVFDKLIPA